VLAAAGVLARLLGPFRRLLAAAVLGASFAVRLRLRLNFGHSMHPV